MAGGVGGTGLSPAVAGGIIAVVVVLIGGMVYYGVTREKTEVSGEKMQEYRQMMPSFSAPPAGAGGAPGAPGAPGYSGMPGSGGAPTHPGMPGSGGAPAHPGMPAVPGMPGR